MRAFVRVYFPLLVIFDLCCVCICRGSLAQTNLELPAQSIPVPVDTVSPQMRALIEIAPPGVSVVGEVESAPAAATSSNEDIKNAEALDVLVNRFRIQIESVKLAGVDCYVLTPEGIPRHNVKRILYHLHGGAYIGGGGKVGLLEGALVAYYARMKVIFVDYRLAPEHPFPAAIDDIMMVWSEIVKTIDHQNVGVVGSSTGGALTLSLVQRIVAQNGEVPGAIAAGTPWSDLSKTGDSYYTNAHLDNVTGPYELYLADAARMYAGGVDLKDPQISPIYGTFEGFPPTILLTGTRDIFLSNTVRVAEKLRDTGVETDLHVYEGQSHAHYLRQFSSLSRP